MLNVDHEDEIRDFVVYKIRKNSYSYTISYPTALSFKLHLSTVSCALCLLQQDTFSSNQKGITTPVKKITSCRDEPFCVELSMQDNATATQ